MSMESIFASPRYCSADEAVPSTVSVDDLKNGKYVFEYIRAKMTRFYADIDIKTPMTSAEFNDLRIRANKIFSELYRTKGYVYTDGSYEDGNKRKLSFHLINKNIQIYKEAFSWKNTYGKFMKDEILEGFDREIEVEGKKIYPRNLFGDALDDEVYGKKPCFRLPYATYEAPNPSDNKPHPHVPMIDTGDISDYFVTICSGARHPLMDVVIKEYRAKEAVIESKKQDLEMKQAQNPGDFDLDKPITEERQNQILEKLNVIKKDRFKDLGWNSDWAKLGRLIKCNKIDKSILLQISKESAGSEYDEDGCLAWWFSEKSNGKVGFNVLNKWLEEDGIDLKMFCPKTKTIVGKMLSKINETGTLTHAHIAEIFFEEKKDDIYNTQMGWLVFDEVKGWVLGNDQLILLPFIKTCGMALNNYVSSMKSSEPDGKFTPQEQKKKDLLRKISNKILDYSYISKAIKVMTMMFLNHDIIKEFDCHPEFFAFSNLKAWDLEHGKVVDITKHHKIFTTCGYPMPERIENEVEAAKQFILTYQDESAIDSFLSMCACSLYGKNKNQVIFIHTGVGGNGKSVHADLMTKTLGNYAGLLPIEQFTVEAKSRSEANSSLAAMVGKRYARANEPEDDAGQKLKISRIKQLTGDEEVDVRKLYGETFQMVIRFTPHILANDIPSLSKQDGGIARRIKVVRYPYIFKDHPDSEDPLQKQKILELNLDQYKHGFFYLCADAWLKTKGVYQETVEVKEDVDEYLRENNPLIPFLSTFKYSDKPMLSKTLHDLFNVWCDKAKVERYKSKAFTIILENAVLPDGNKVKILKDPKNGHKVFVTME